MTQKYEPVEWTDETPTQPGTLINKERLDQMQSAHHFADGFEEVDAVPTEDPGTDYHKVVYCTADSTFYRWDGDEWTADIDDDTKRLLLEHEADHSNPHAVTKAQVGLGNADNTADLDKPISTATQTALGLIQGYLDAHEANHSNPHVVTKAQVGLGNCDNTSDADKPISTAVATALTDGSVTKVGTANVGSDTLPIKLVGGSPTPVADALAKDGAVVHNTGDETIDGLKQFNYTPRGLRFVSATSGQKELFRIAANTDITSVTTYLVGRITDKSNTREATFMLGFRTSNYIPVLIVSAPMPNFYCTLNADYSVSLWFGAQRVLAFVDTMTRSNSASEYDISKYVVVGSTILPSKPTAGDDYPMVVDATIMPDLIDQAALDGYATMVRTVNAQTIAGDKTFTAQMLATGQRAYDTANETDVVTIGTLKASTDVVHTSGAETIQGTKTFYASSFSTIKIKSNRATGNIGGMDFINKDNTTTAQIYAHTSGSITLSIGTAAADAAIIALNQRAYDAANTTDVVTIGTLDAYTPMVRTVNAQTISGNKTFNDHILASTSVQNVPAVMPRAAGTGWVKLYETADTNHANAILAMLPRRATSNPGFGILAVGGHNNGTVICKWMAKDLVDTNYLDKVMVTIEANVITVWGANISATDNVNMRIISDVFNGSYMLTNTGFKAATDTAIYTMTTDGGGNITGYTDSDSVVHTFIAYEISS